jgi:peptidoglycan/xylan/chitin deacetylase (PgdA/CDA1 family)
VASRPLVLCYHAVSDGWDDVLSVGPLALERQLRRLLALRYRPASAGEAVAHRGRVLHVTFDDAFRSVHAAVPVLERLGVPATVFACTGYAERGDPLAVPELAAEAAAHPGELATMTWDELRSLAERGVEVGSHTVTHAHLRRLAHDDLARELRDSRERLEAELDRPCRFLAYPYGEEDGRVRRAAREAGYEAAFGLSPDGVADRFAVPRVGIWRHDGLARVTLKTAPAVWRGVALARRLGVKPAARTSRVSG